LCNFVELHENVQVRKSASAKLYAVITADIVGSRQIPSFREKRDRRLRPLSTQHRAEGLILSEYAVTAWDEFQVILQRPLFLPRLIFAVRRHFYPMRLRIAAGFGRVSEAHKTPVNVYAGGEAFERARRAADRLKKAGSKFPMLTAIESGNPTFDMIANTMYHLHDTLLQEISPRQWRTIAALEATGSQEAAARKLRVNISTVSRTLRRAHYWQLEESRTALEQVIEAYF
jgi:hypothetical protein